MKPANIAAGRRGFPLLFAFFLLVPALRAADQAFVPKVIIEHGFEGGNAHGWVTRGGNGVITLSDKVAHSGSSSLRMSGRSLDWHSARLELTKYFEAGAKYHLELWARAESGAAAFAISMLTRYAKEDVEAPITEDVKIDSTSWTKLEGDFYFDPNAAGAFIYAFYRGDVTAPYYIDDFKVTMIAPGSAPGATMTVKTSDFEKGDLQDWKPRGEGTNITVTPEASKSGSSSLKTSGRSANWAGPSLETAALLKKGRVYDISCAVRLAGSAGAKADFKITIEEKTPTGGTNWRTVAQESAGSSGWTTLAGKYSPPGGLDSQLLYIETSDQAVFFIDDFSITTPNVPEAQTPIQKDIPSLKEAFKDDFIIGAAVSPSRIIGSPGELLKKHFGSIVADNAMKSSLIHPIEGNYYWDDVDKIVEFAEANGMELRFHTLQWHEQAAAWFFLDKDGKDMTKETDPAKRAENKALLLKRLEDHIAAIGARYKNRIGSWDVVNEVIDVNGPDGLRNSQWLQIAGPEFISVAFRSARKALGPEAKLYINDYNTHEPAKRDALHGLVKKLLAEGVPIDGVGHQMHISVENPSIELIDATIRLFGGLGLDNQITEMDVSVYSSNSSAYKAVPAELIIRQGYRFKELFEKFRELKDFISNVTFWGIADDNSWLHNRPIPRKDAPLVFDEDYHAKPAFWGMVDPARLPVPAQTLTVPIGGIKLDGEIDELWKFVPWTPIAKGLGSASAFKALWDGKNLSILVEAKDPSADLRDSVDIYLDPANAKKSAPKLSIDTYRLARNASRSAFHRVVEIPGGYLLEASIPLPGAAPGKRLGFDVSVHDGSEKDTRTSWNDPTASQIFDMSKYGTIVLGKEAKVAKARKGSPKIDGSIDPIWGAAQKIKTSIPVMAKPGAAADVRALWDENCLYVLFEVLDPDPNLASPNPYEQDSIEVFIDENNAKTPAYEADDGQFRVGYRNLQTFGSNGKREGFESAAIVLDGGYRVEAAIPFKTIKGKAGAVIGFDVQVNDAGNDGKRKAIMKWNDPTDSSYKDTSGFGWLEMVE